MKPVITKKGIKLILNVLVFGLIAVALFHKYGPKTQQAKNMALARVYAEEKMQEIAGQEEFAYIEITEYTAGNGSMLVQGMLKDEASEVKLRDIIYRDNPPTEVFWIIRAGPRYWEYAKEHEAEMRLKASES
ncbi:MAG: hypothetical protein ACQKBW_07985 [Puniceicoccales bacterium]